MHRLTRSLLVVALIVCGGPRPAAQTLDARPLPVVSSLIDAMRPNMKRLGVQIPTTIFVGASDVDWTGREPDAGEFGFGLDMAGDIGDRTKLALSFVRGPVQIVSPLTLLGAYRPTVRLAVDNPSWNLVGGALMSSYHALAGPAIRANGASLRFRRRVVADLTVARPNTFAGDDGGHVFQGRFGIAHPLGSVAVVGSDLSRPLAQFPVASATLTDASDGTVSELTELRRLWSRESRVRGVGIEADLKWRNHALLVRGGELSLANTFGQQTEGFAGEMRYNFTRGRGAINGYVRREPRSLPGAFVPGDAVLAGASLPVSKTVALFGHGYSKVDWTIGQDEPIRSAGLIGGVRRHAGQSLVTLQLNERRLRSAVARFDSTSHTLSVTLAVPWRPLRLDVQAEAGPSRRGNDPKFLQMYRIRLSVDGSSRQLWVAGSYEDYGYQPPRSRGDAGLSAQVGGAEFEIGAGFGTGQVFGSHVSAFGSLDVPLPRGAALVAQVDYLRWDYFSSPYLNLLLNSGPSSPWRLSLGVRRAFPVPIPFARRTVSTASRDPGNR